MSKVLKKTLKQHGDQYTKLSMPHFLKKRTFSTRFLDLCKNNPNQPQFQTSDVKTVLRIMAMEQGLYEQVVMIRRNNLDNKKEKENTKKYKFQGQSARSKRWLDLDHECL